MYFFVHKYSYILHANYLQLKGSLWFIFLHNSFLFMVWHDFSWLKPNKQENKECFSSWGHSFLIENFSYRLGKTQAQL